MIGSASLVSEVNTSSPSLAVGQHLAGLGVDDLGQKWSSQITGPSLVSTHSLATPGPITSDRP
jgi:hypothetical protein